MTRLVLTALWLPSAAMAYEYGPLPRYTGAPGDAPLACASAMCHTSLPAGGPINALAGGVHATFSSGSSYTPGGSPITIVVNVSDPVNTHYGFQMTARPESNLADGQAGDFNTGTTASCPAIAAPCEIVICDVSGSVKLPGKLCPASAPVEFIEHSYPAGSQVSTTPYTFTWTPPATNVGPVHFYIAGNAVNGDLMADGRDHVYTNEFTLTPVLCSNLKPVIRSVVSASAFGDLPTFTSGSWIEIYGSNFSSDTWQWQGTDFNGVNAPTSLAGITASINGIPAYVWYLRADGGQINVLAPADPALTSVPVVVKSCTQASDPFMAQKAALVPGLLAPPGFLVNGKQYLVAQFQDQTFVGDPSVVPGTSRPAKPGDLLVVYGVGFGEADDASGPIAPGTIATDANTLKNPLTIAFGTTPAPFVYDGLAPGYVGLYQFDITVPNVPDGDTPINVTLNGVPIQQQLYLTIHH